MDFLENAFRSLRSLDEEVFDLSIDGSNDELKDFLDTDEQIDTVTIIDDEAEDEEDLQDSYMGKVILDCNVCHSLIYKNPDEVVLDGDEANIEEECPYCYSLSGYKVVGQVKPFSQVEDELEDEESEEDEILDSEDDYPEDEKVETSDDLEFEEDKDDLDESLNEALNPLSLGRDKLIDAIDEFYSHSLNDDRRYWIENLLNSNNASEDDSDEYEGFYSTMSNEDLVKVFNEIRKELSMVEEDDDDFNFDDKIFKTFGLVRNWFDESLEDDDVDEATKRSYDAFGVASPQYDKDKFKKYLDSKKKEREMNASDLGGALAPKKESMNESSIFDDVDESILEDDDNLEECGDSLEDEPLQEDLKNVDVTTDSEHLHMDSDESGRVTITSEPIEPVMDDIPMNNTGIEEPADGEVIGEVDADVQDDIMNPEEESEEDIDDILGDEEDSDEDEFDVDEFDEESFDDLGESYLKNVYENVNSFKSTKSYEDGNKLVVEGIINFKSGSNKKTSFVFEAKNATDNSILFEGYNKEITRANKGFKLNCTVDGSKMYCEKLSYRYNSNKQLVEGVVKR